MDFHVVKDMDTEELEELIEEEVYSFSETLILKSELLMRQLNEKEPGVLEDFETIKEKRDFQLYDKKKEQWKKAHEDNEEELERMFPELRAVMRQKVMQVLY